MFRPNQTCLIKLASGKTDVYGQPLPTTSVLERCAVVKLNIKSQISAIRADASASRGNARELVSEVVILLTPTTQANIDDVIEIADNKIRVTAKRPQYAVTGSLDHYRVEGMIWD